MRRIFVLVMMLGAISANLLAQANPEIVVSVGHSNPPTLAAFSGKELITANSSNIAVIDLSSGLTINHLPQGSLVMSIEASPAGDLVAVGTCDHAVQLWDSQFRGVARRLTLPQECAESVSFSPDGALLAVGAYGCGCGSGQNGLQIWNTRTGELVRLLAPGAPIQRVVFSGNGRWVAGIDGKGKATVFEWPSGQDLRTLNGPALKDDFGPAAIASADGRYIAWIGEDLEVWDVTTGDIVASAGAGFFISAEFLSDGRLAYADDDRLVLKRLPDGPKQEISLPQAKTTMYGDVGLTEQHSWLKIRKDGSLLVGTRGSQTIAFDFVTKQFRQLTSPALTSQASLQWSSSGTIAWVDTGSGVYAWDTRFGKPVIFTGTANVPTSIAFQRDGARLASAGYASISVLDLATRRSVATKDVDDVETGISFSPDGSQIVFGSSSHALSLFDTNFRLLRSISTLDEYTSAERIAFSPDGRWIAAGLVGPHPAIRVWPANGSNSSNTLETTDVIYGPQPPAFSGDSRRMASFRRGKELVIWSTGSWDVERTWTLSGKGRALSFAPVGSRLAVASDGQSAIWDSDDGRRVVTFSSPGSAQMTEIAWSPDGRQVVTSADDGVLRFWNSSEGRLLASLYILPKAANWLLMTPDGRLDGSKGALMHLIAWRVNGRVALDENLTNRHHVRGLWRSLSASPLVDSPHVP